MSERKKLEPEDFVTVSQGDPQHPVWQAAYGAAFVAVATHDNVQYAEAAERAARLADVSYATYKAACGAPKWKKTPGGKKEVSFSMGNHIVKGESERAIMIDTPQKLLVAFDGKEQAWIPKSQIHSDSQVDSDGEEGELLVTAWWAEKRGMLDGEETAEPDDVPF